MMMTAKMIDWLRRSPRAAPAPEPVAKPAPQPGIEIAGRHLPIVIRRLARAQQLTMRLAPDGSEIRISMPRWARDAEALRFARKRADWLASQLAVHVAPQTLRPGSTLPFRGAPLALCHSPGTARRITLGEGQITLGGPLESLERRLARWLQAEARTAFADDLAHYSAIAGVGQPAMALSNAKARWGSCSSRGVVRLNWRLMMAPDIVRRSVVAHEVAHLVHFDHSPSFHALLGQIFEGDINAANHWLRQNGRSLYAYFA